MAVDEPEVFMILVLLHPGMIHPVTQPLSVRSVPQVRTSLKRGAPDRRNGVVHNEDRALMQTPWVVYVVDHLPDFLCGTIYDVGFAPFVAGVALD